MSKELVEIEEVIKKMLNDEAKFDVDIVATKGGNDMNVIEENEVFLFYRKNKTIPEVVTIGYDAELKKYLIKEPKE